MAKFSEGGKADLTDDDLHYGLVGERRTAIATAMPVCIVCRLLGSLLLENLDEFDYFLQEH